MNIKEYMYIYSETETVPLNSCGDVEAKTFWNLLHVANRAATYKGRNARYVCTMYMYAHKKAYTICT